MENILSPYLWISQNEKKNFDNIIFHDLPCYCSLLESPLPAFPILKHSLADNGFPSEINVLEYFVSKIS